MDNELNCFKSYDIRGKIGAEINEEICYQIGSAFCLFFNAKKVVVGYDARATSELFSKCVVDGALDQGCDVILLGLCGTEEVYWATSAFEACGGIQITASHNPINYNGMKLVKCNSEPLDPTSELIKIKELVARANFRKIKRGVAIYRGKDARKNYVKKVLSFINSKNIQNLRVVVNGGNGAVGPTFDEVEKKIKAFGATVDFIKVNYNPDSSFPNGIPNPLLPDRHPFMKEQILKNGAHLGIAFDGDFDRCFFFDELGNFVKGEYLVGIMAEKFLNKRNNDVIIHDPRIVWNIQDIVMSNGGQALQSNTGHAFIKKSMRENNAVYGGEMSAHHYFRDFAFCDSGIIPCLIMMEMLSKDNVKLSSLVKIREQKFPSSGEINFEVKDPSYCIERVSDFYKEKCLRIDVDDGVSFYFKEWRFNLRGSKTEPLLRLNIETRGNKNLLIKQQEAISNILLDL